MQIEKEFEKNFQEYTKFKIKELRYLKPPELPYCLYTNRRINKGADTLNNIIENNIIIERYSKTNNSDDEKDCERISGFLDKYFPGNKFEKYDGWLNSEDLYGTFWELEPILEKVRKESVENGRE